MKARIALLMAAAMFGLALTAQAETTVTVKKVHLCCGQCVQAVGKAIGAVDGAKAKCDQKAGIVTITASDDETAQKALDALSKAGFHGATDNEKLAIKDDSGAGKDAVKRLEVEGVHNCCAQCCKIIKGLVTKVKGVEGTNVKPKAESFAIEGDFSPAELVKALNDAGFHAKVKKE